MNCQGVSSSFNHGEAAQQLAEPDDPFSLLIDSTFVMDKPQLHTGSAQPRFCDWPYCGNDCGGGAHDAAGSWFYGAQAQEYAAAASPSNNSLSHFNHPEEILGVGNWILLQYYSGPEPISFQDYTFDFVTSHGTESMPGELPNDFSPSSADGVDASLAPITTQETAETRPLLEHSQLFTLPDSEISPYTRCMAEFGLQERSFPSTQPGPKAGSSATQDGVALSCLSTSQPSQGCQTASSTSQYVPSVCSSVSSPPSSSGTSQRTYDFIHEDPSTPTQHSASASPPPRPTGNVQCPHCSTRLKNQGNLTRHLREVHKITTSGPLPEFPCPLEGCEKSFPRKHKLEEHWSTHNKGPMPLDLNEAGRGASKEAPEK